MATENRGGTKMGKCIVDDIGPVVSTAGRKGLVNYIPGEGASSATFATQGLGEIVNNHLKYYEIIIVMLYLPSHKTLRDYISKNLEHLDALSGNRILLISFESIINDTEKLIELWTNRLGSKYQQEIRERMTNYVFDEQIIYRIADEARISFEDFPCVLIAHPTNTKANQIRLPILENEKEYETYFVEIIDTAKQSLGLRSNKIRISVKKLWRRKLQSLKNLLFSTNKELEFFAAQLTQLKESVVKIINPFSPFTEGVAKLISQGRSQTNTK